MRRLATLTASLLTALLLVLSSPSAAHAASPKPIARTKYSTTYKLDRQQTKSVAQGAALAAVLFGRSQWWGVPTGVAAWWVWRVYDQGKCLYVQVGWPSRVWGGKC